MLTETQTLTHSTPSSSTPIPPDRWVRRITHILAGTIAVGSAITTALQTPISQALEQHIRTSFFELRGPVVPPSNLIILAMDAESMDQGRQIYQSDPKKYAYFEPLKTAPWKRSAYAIALDRLMQAGAKSVGVDIVFDVPSSHGTKDDQTLVQVLRRYSDRITLAAMFEDDVTVPGDRTQLASPHPQFQVGTLKTGFINFPVANNGQIIEFGRLYPQKVAATYGQTLGPEFLSLNADIPDFATAVLSAAQKNSPPIAPPRGNSIFFYGPSGTFPQVPFWHLLDPVMWQKHRQNNTFKDKIVLIGPTAMFYQDFHRTPFGGTIAYPNRLAGVELHANAIATLQENRAIGEGLPTWAQGLWVLGIVAIGAITQIWVRRPLLRLGISLGSVMVVGAIGFGLFGLGRLWVPTAVPMGAIAAMGSSYFLSGVAGDYLRKRQLKDTLSHYSASPIVQQILSQQGDVELSSLVQDREQQVVDRALAGRYWVTKLLNSGGFGETYLAEDRQRPGNPLCVVKQLRPVSNSLKVLEMARRMFDSEAKILERLGTHDRIPQLLAYFEEEGEFYLVQEFIEGHPLSAELTLGKQLPEAKVIVLLREGLKILEFVHSQGVIHRDIKPSNIMRRNRDGRLVLIDFGAVKELEVLEDDEQGETRRTVAIGTPGYMPSEQSAGHPQFASDIYALGMMAIQALVGLPPSKLKQDSKSGEVLWRYSAQVGQALADVISKMVAYDYRDRFASATDVLQALHQIDETTGDRAEWMHSSLAETEFDELDGEDREDSPTSLANTATCTSTRLWPVENLRPSRPLGPGSVEPETEPATASYTDLLTKSISESVTVSYDAFSDSVDGLGSFDDVSDQLPTVTAPGMTTPQDATQEC